MTQNYIYTIAGTGAGSYAGDGGPATTAQLFRPTAMAIDTLGNIYEADWGNARIRRIDHSTGTITTVAGNGIAGYSGDGGAAVNASINGPESIALDSTGNLYFSDTGNNVIRKVDTSGNITTLAGTGIMGFQGDGSPATYAAFDDPYGVTVDKQGNLYIADYFNNRVRVVSHSTGIITTFAGGGSSGDDSPATSALLNHPVGVAADSQGNILIAEQGAGRIRRVDASTGYISTLAGDGTIGNTGDGGPATSAQITALGVSVGPDGNIYVASGPLVREVNTGTGTINTVIGTGTGGYSGDGGPAVNAQISAGGDNGIAIDASGNLYVPDYNNNVVREIYEIAAAVSTPPSNATYNLGSSFTTYKQPDKTYDGIEFQTLQPNDFVVGDTVKVSGTGNPNFDQTFTVYSVLDSNTFTVYDWEFLSFESTSGGTVQKQ